MMVVPVERRISICPLDDCDGGIIAHDVGGSVRPTINQRVTASDSTGILGLTARY